MGKRKNAAPSSGSYRLFFLKKGKDMAAIHIEGSAKIQGLKERARVRDAVVLDAFDSKNPPYPTHIVVSNTPIPAASIAEALGFASTEQFASFLTAHSIQVVTRRWADKGNMYSYPPFAPPTLSELHYGFVLPSPDAPSSPTHRPVRAAARKTTRVGAYPKNQELSNLFRDMAKLYQSAPLDNKDEFRALTFSMLASRVRRLDFEAKDSDSVKNVKGFGPTTRQIIQEYLDTNSCRRLNELETDPERVRVRQFMNIWGVGKVRARELASEANNLDDLKRGLESGRIKLDRNQLIGLQCYEDILEEMPRSEAEAIFGIVKGCVHERFPSAELSLMGSYRRGMKETCGDVDILITHPDYVEGVHPQYLGKIVDDLCSQGRIAFHLTYIAGMRPENFETLPEDSKRYLTDPSHYGRAAEKKDKRFGSSSSYMGVFHSPVVPGRRRRVDIKFYPHRERAFATLYFTGNGYFNRSMRLWSDRKKNATLNDHGLFEIGTESRVRDKSGKDFLPTAEREIFDWLGLVWKEPNERDGFDAVEAIDGTFLDVENLSQKEKELEVGHKWIE